jgi:hypothetical protein
LAARVGGTKITKRNTKRTHLIDTNAVLSGRTRVTAAAAAAASAMEGGVREG